MAGTLLQACDYSDTGNVLTVQALLKVCARYPEADDKDAAAKKAEAKAVERSQATAAAAALKGLLPVPPLQLRTSCVLAEEAWLELVLPALVLG